MQAVHMETGSPTKAFGEYRWPYPRARCRNTTRGSSPATRSGKSTPTSTPYFRKKILQAGGNQTGALGIKDDVEVNEQHAAAIHVALQGINNRRAKGHAGPGDDYGIGIVGHLLCVVGSALPST